MKTKKNRIVLSGISVLLVLSLLVGGTMAWFTDTEQVNANFSAGVLDIVVTPDKPAAASLEFTNLRPMLEENFYKELTDDGGANKLENNSQNPANYPADNIPTYFKPVKITNNGTLPAYIRLTVEPDAKAMKACRGEENTGITGENLTEVDWDKENPIDCENGLEDMLKIFVYRRDAANPAGWTKVENINLNTGSKETIEGTDKKEKDQYNPNTVLGAGDEADYVVAGYLPDTANNTYQGKHFHGDLIVNAFQTDKDAGGTPGEEGGDKPTPGTVKNTINVNFKEKDQIIGDSKYTFTANTDDTQYILRPADLAGITPTGYKVTGLEEIITRSLILEIPLENGKLVNEAYMTITAIVEKDGDTPPPTDVTKKIPVSYQTPDGAVQGTGELSVTFKSGETKTIPASNYTDELAANCPTGYVLGSLDGLNITVANGEVTSGTLVVPVTAQELPPEWPTELTAVVHYNATDEKGNPVAVEDGSYTFAVTKETYTYPTDSIPEPADGEEPDPEYPDDPDKSIYYYFEKTGISPEEITISNASGAWTASEVTMTVVKHPGYAVTAGNGDNGEVIIVLRDVNGNNPVDSVAPGPIVIRDKALLEQIKASNTYVQVMATDERIQMPEVAGYVPRPGLPVHLQWVNNEVKCLRGLLYNRIANVSAQSLAKMSASSRTLFTSALNLAKAGLAVTTADTVFVFDEPSLNEVKNNLDATVEIFDHFSMSSNWTPATGAFTGTFLGNNYTISNLTVSSTGTGVGLFSVNSGTIQELTMENASVTGSRNVGIIAGENTADGKIVNCKVSGSVNGTFVDSTQLDGEATAVGGIVGLNEGTIEKSRSDANAAGPFGVGSLVGVNTGAVKTSFATGSVNASVSDLDAYYTLNNYYPAKHFGKYQAAGGLVGSNYGGTVENSYAYAPDGVVRGFALVGGLVGDNYNGTVQSSWSRMGNVNVSALLTYGDGTACTHYAHFCVATDSYNGTVNNTYYTDTNGNTFYYGSEGNATGWGEKKNLSTLPAGFNTSVWTITGGQPDLIENPLNGSVTPPPPPEHPQLDLDVPAYRIKGTVNNINNPGQVKITPDLFNAVVAANGAAYQEPLESDRITLPNMPADYRVATSPVQKLNMKWDAAQGKIVVLSAIGVEPVTATPGTNEYSIYTQSDLEAVADNLGASYYLWNDVSIMSNWEPLGWTASDDVPFTGVFKGQGFAIHDLNADYSGSGNNYYSNVGLFALNQGVIQDLTVNTGSTGVIGGTKVGIIAGQNLGTIQRCHANGHVAGLYTQTSQDPNCVGGVTGINGTGATLMQCSSSAEAYGYAYVASLAGQNWGDIKQCYSTGGVNATNTADQIANSSTIYTYMASLVGGNKGTINNSYALVPNSTSIRGTYRIGGLVGANFSGGVVKNSYVVCDSAYTVNHYNQTGVGHRCIGYNAGTVSNVFYQSNSQSGVNQGVAKTSLMGDVLKNQGFNTNLWNFPANSYPNLKGNKR